MRPSQWRVNDVKGGGRSLARSPSVCGTLESCRLNLFLLWLFFHAGLQQTSISSVSFATHVPNISFEPLLIEQQNNPCWVCFVGGYSGDESIEVKSKLPEFKAEAGPAQASDRPWPQTSCGRGGSGGRSSCGCVFYLDRKRGAHFGSLVSLTDGC